MLNKLILGSISYAEILLDPISPYPALNLIFVKASKFSMNFSLLKFQPMAKEGNSPNLNSSLNNEDPSRRKLAVSKYLSSNT